VGGGDDSLLEGGRGRVSGEKRAINRAGALVGDSAPAPCHVGNQVLRSRDDPFERASLGRAIARNKLSRRDDQAEFLVSSRDVGGRRSTSRFNDAIRPALCFTTRPGRARYFMRSRQKDLRVFQRVMQLPRDADCVMQRLRRGRMRSRATLTSLCAG